METRCITDRRDAIIHVLETELHAKAGFSGVPDFTCTVGGMSLLRDGRIISGNIPDETSSAIFQRLAYLGLCEWPEHAAVAKRGGRPEHADKSAFSNSPGISAQERLLEPEAESDFCYSIDDRDGHVLRNLFSIISARQRLLNQALASRNAFTVSPLLMDRLLAHPPETVPEVLQVLYDNAGEYQGIRIDRFPARRRLECTQTGEAPGDPREESRDQTCATPGGTSLCSVTLTGFDRCPREKSRDQACATPGGTSLCSVTLTGFDRCPREDRHIHKQLADRIMAAARSLHWVKPYTRNVRNRKYAFHTWLYSIGMAGPEYEEARSVLLGRLYGNTGHRKLDR